MSHCVVVVVLDLVCRRPRRRRRRRGCRHGCRRRRGRRRRIFQIGFFNNLICPNWIFSKMIFKTFFDSGFPTFYFPN